MAQNRSERPLPQCDNLPVQVEALRQAAETSKPQDAGKDESKIPLFWRICGGTVLSISALVVMTAYQSVSGNIAELSRQVDHLETDNRKEMSRLAELQGELIRREEGEARVRGIWDQLDEAREDRKMISQAREQCQGLLEQRRRAEAQRATLRREVQEVRERRAAAALRGELGGEVARLRERLSAVEAGQPSPGLRPVMHAVGE